MTDQTNRPAIDLEQVAWNALSIAQGAAERGEQKLAETESLLSIAASLRQVCLQNDAALDCHDQGIALSAKSLELTERLVAIAESARPVEIPGQLVEGGGCCCQVAQPTDELLEMAFGLVCGVDQGVNVPRPFPHQPAEWVETARSFISGYNALVGYKHSGSTLPFHTWRAQQNERLTELRDKLAAQAEEALASELDERSQT